MHFTGPGKQATAAFKAYDKEAKEYNDKGRQADEGELPLLNSKNTYSGCTLPEGCYLIKVCVHDNRMPARHLACAHS